MLHNDTGHRRGNSYTNRNTTNDSEFLFPYSSNTTRNKIPNRGPEFIPVTSRAKLSNDMGDKRATKKKILVSGVLGFMFLAIISYTIAAQINYNYDTYPQIVTKTRP